MDDMDEFEQFKAMAYNQNRRGSQSMPCTPQVPTRQIFNFTRETSKSERRRKSTKRRNNNFYQNHNSMLSDNEMRICNSTSGETDLTDRLSRLSMTEIWVRRLKLRHGSSSDHEEDIPSPDVNVLYPEMYASVEQETFQQHPPLSARRSNPDPSSCPKNKQFLKVDHRRSMSCRDRTRTRKCHDIDQTEFAIRPRTSSMPSKGHIKRPDSLPVKTNDDSPKENSVEYYLVRTFSTSKKGLINRGDSFKKRKTPISHAAENDANSVVLSNASSVCSIPSAKSEAPAFKVFMIGGNGAGKTSLLQQFTSSDYMANMRLDSFADAENETRESKLVSVLLDGEESSLFFVTASNLDETLSACAPDAYVVVYSVSDRDTFDQAVDIVQEINQRQASSVAVILVANKGDMVRSRVVEEQDGKEVAVHFNCKYIEVSALMNLRVDELLAGIVKQIRLTEIRLHKRNSKKIKHSRTTTNKDGNGCIEHAARGIVGKIFRRTSPMFRSCDNLLVV